LRRCRHDLAERAGGAGHHNNPSVHDGTSKAGQGLLGFARGSLKFAPIM
jgi:hypothetical protein